jgi:hypothetical protein
MRWIAIAMVMAWTGCGSAPSCDDVVAHAVTLFIANPQNADHALAQTHGDKSSEAYKHALRACTDGIPEHDHPPLTAEQKDCVMKATDDRAVNECFPDGHHGYLNPLTGRGGGYARPR